MAQRLATEYIKASLRLTEVQMAEFIHRIDDPHVRQRIKVLDGGGQEVVLEDDQGEELHLPFDRKDGYYICEASFRLINPPITNVMRRLFAAYKGSGIVNRIYNGFVVMYQYEDGQVRRITEHNGDTYKLVYEYKNTVEELQRLFRSTEVEMEIGRIHRLINDLLDHRLALKDEQLITHIDEELRQYTRRLFVLEA
ncbi:non-ribosomal peptide synthetase module [Paenibacillus zeisoli]|uniref:Non-ribosomal peptide synthetase module n=1 Tax=Paenibacillus zeisoli TaxID=2496267 RepID=A0A433X0V4_9BACL|nr:non-ribosomal peptide synthetase module [Paenibacillus zeisoli]RUT27785.1 non-ribosomal peptide synthetase module [Paenibacillus zeisoli]